MKLEPNQFDHDDYKPSEVRGFVLSIAVWVMAAAIWLLAILLLMGWV